MKHLETIRGYCHRCAAVHLWSPVRGGRALRCEGCGDRFPCRSARCGHLDCEAARLELNDSPATVAGEMEGAAVQQHPAPRTTETPHDQDRT